ncbi:hypothetical protein FB451DRAFT_1568499 [Mycena latifolia]|nr:hypothetical protein FB451DRAFT_1568499 [Mycena latifolia]
MLYDKRRAHRDAHEALKKPNELAPTAPLPTCIRQRNLWALDKQIQSPSCVGIKRVQVLRVRPQCPLGILRNYSSSGENAVMGPPVSPAPHIQSNSKRAAIAIQRFSSPLRRGLGQKGVPRQRIRAPEMRALHIARHARRNRTRSPCSLRRSCYSSTFDNSGRVSLHSASRPRPRALVSITYITPNLLWTTRIRHRVPSSRGCARVALISHILEGDPGRTHLSAVIRAPAGALPARHPRCLPYTLHTPRTRLRIMHTYRQHTPRAPRERFATIND